MPLVSHRNALFIRNEVPGVKVPEDVIARMAEHPTGDDAPGEYSATWARNTVPAASSTSR